MAAQQPPATLSPPNAYERVVVSDADYFRMERLIAAGHLSPGALSMPLADAINRHNRANALEPGDPDYLDPPTTTVTLADAIDLLPDAWHAGIVADAASQGATVSYTAAACGLRTETIARIKERLATHDGDVGALLDSLFPQYNGIGAFEFLEEIGVAPVYLSVS